jgi:hypothetical protein
MRERAMPVSWDVIASVADIPTVAAAAVVALLIVAFAPRQARALVLWFSQYAAFVALLLATAVAARQGYGIGGAIGEQQGLNGLDQAYASVAGAIVGGLAGLTMAALVVALLFVLLEIRDNTKG